MKNAIRRQLGLVKRDEKGFTLLEYIAGAAVLLGVVWVALTTMGTSMSGVINQMTLWLNNRKGDIQP